MKAGLGFFVEDEDSLARMSAGYFHSGGETDNSSPDHNDIPGLSGHDIMTSKTMIIRRNIDVPVCLSCLCPAKIGLFYGVDAQSQPQYVYMKF
jgi:hypothetical protein